MTLGVFPTNNNDPAFVFDFTTDNLYCHVNVNNVKDKPCTPASSATTRLLEFS